MIDREETHATGPAVIPDVWLGRSGWQWLAGPAADVELGDDGLTWRCATGTDLWRITEGVATKHDAQALLAPLGAGDFTFEATFHGKLEARYDQVGVLVEADERHWLKVGVELDEESWLGAVHTRESSDWSREPWRGGPATLRIERHEDAIHASVQDPDGAFRTFRVLHLPGPVRVGPYACAPQGPGFAARMTAARID